MQQRRLRPGDVLDDYCPRERRVTDHAIVAMIDDEIQQTRCVVCDAEHEYKQAKVPAQRRKKTPALFTQVLDGLKAPARPPQLPDLDDGEPAELHVDDDADVPEVVAEVVAIPIAPSNGNGRGTGSTDTHPDPVLAAAPEDTAPGTALDEDQSRQGDGPLFRRQLIRAALPRPEGTTPPTRVMPEFTIRQPAGRHNRHAGKRRGQPQGQNGQTRFGRGGGQGRPNGHGRSGGGSGFGNQGNTNGNRSGRRGGKKR